MKKKRMEYCEVISSTLYTLDSRGGAPKWSASKIDAHEGCYGHVGLVPIQDYTLNPSPERAKYYEKPGERNRACIYYGTDGYKKLFEADADGNTIYFPSALDAVNYLAEKCWYLDNTFKDSHGYEHWIMAREIEVDE